MKLVSLLLISLSTPVFANTMIKAEIPNDIAYPLVQPIGENIDWIPSRFTLKPVYKTYYIMMTRYDHWPATMPDGVNKTITIDLEFKLLDFDKGTGIYHYAMSVSPTLKFVYGNFDAGNIQAIEKDASVTFSNHQSSIVLSGNINDNKHYPLYKQNEHALYLKLPMPIPIEINLHD